MAGVLALGLGQAILGGALCVFTLGAGATVGASFLQEGISDLYTAVKDGIINRDFSWAAYGFQKAVSLVVSVCCLGKLKLKV